MKVAMVLPGGLAPSDERRGIPYLQSIVERIAQRHELYVYAVQRDLVRNAFDLAGAHVRVLGRPFSKARAVAGIVAEHRRRAFDVLHAFWAHWPGTVAATAARLIRRPMLLHLAGGELVGLPDIGYGTMVRWRGRVAVRFALRSAACISAASSPMRDLATQLGYTTIEIPLGVDIGRWPPRPPRRRPIGEPARLLHVGTLNRVKDQTTLLRAVELLQRAGVDFRLDIVGEDILDGEIQARALELGLTRRVTFHGYLPHDRVRSMMDEAALLLV